MRRSNTYSIISKLLNCILLKIIYIYNCIKSILLIFSISICFFADKKQLLGEDMQTSLLKWECMLCIRFLHGISCNSVGLIECVKVMVWFEIQFCKESIINQSWILLLWFLFYFILLQQDSTWEICSSETAWSHCLTFKAAYLGRPISLLYYQCSSCNW